MTKKFLKNILNNSEYCLEKGLFFKGYNFLKKYKFFFYQIKI